MQTTRIGHFLTKTSILAVLLLSCAPSNRPLLSRGLPKSEREFYVIQNGYYMPWNQRQAFIDGQVQPGMTKEMVYQLFGSPDRSFKRDVLWEYVNTKGNPILVITFDSTTKDTVVLVTGNVN